MAEPLGFIGLGNIGSAMAANLLAAGYDLIGFDIRRNDAFVTAGGRFAGSVTELVEALPDGATIFQSLPNEAALEATVEALLADPRGQRLIDVSSYRLQAKQGAAARLADAGLCMLDCEVSGLPPHVAARDATLFTSGEAAAVEASAAYLDAVAKRHIYLGEFGMATRMKLIANVMVCVHNLMSAEALSLGSALGLDPGVMVEALTGSAASSATFVNKAPLMLSRGFDDGRGPFRHMFGYLSRASAMAEEAGVATPLLDKTRAIYAIAEAGQRHDQDIAAIIEIVESLTHRRDAHG